MELSRTSAGVMTRRSYVRTQQQAQPQNESATAAE
jgi:hypothetical protein